MTDIGVRAYPPAHFTIQLVLTGIFFQKQFLKIDVVGAKIKLNDKAYKYFFIAKNYDKLTDEKQKNFLKLEMKNEDSDELSKRILQKVNTAKQNVLLRKKYMEYERQRAYDILLGEERGLEHGLIMGAQQKADEDAIALLKEGLSIEIISRCINIPIEHVRELAAQVEK